MNSLGEQRRLPRGGKSPFEFLGPTLGVGLANPAVWPTSGALSLLGFRCEVGRKVGWGPAGWLQQKLNPFKVWRKSWGPMQECLHGVPLPRATPVPAFLHAPPTASRGPLIPPEFTKVKVAPKSRLIMVLNAAAPAPGAGGVGDAGRWP